MCCCALCGALVFSVVWGSSEWVWQVDQQTRNGVGCVGCGGRGNREAAKLEKKQAVERTALLCDSPLRAQCTMLLKGCIGSTSNLPTPFSPPLPLILPSSLKKSQINSDLSLLAPRHSPHAAPALLLLLSAGLSSSSHEPSACSPCVWGSWRRGGSQQRRGRRRQPGLLRRCVCVLQDSV